jgi:tRNA(Met) cytidine acetyltransferase
MKGRAGDSCFCGRFTGLQRYSLSTPVRWAAGCPLERVVASALLFDDALIDRRPEGGAFNAPEAGTRPALAASVYELLCAAHYRTSPLDLRRMMDAPGQQFAVAETDPDIAGALWLVEEGSPLSLAAPCGQDTGVRAVTWWRSLAAHGGSPLAATLRGRRVTRIAVHPHRQREGLARRLFAAPAAKIICR